MKSVSIEAIMSIENASKPLGSRGALRPGPRVRAATKPCRHREASSLWALWSLWPHWTLLTGIFKEAKMGSRIKMTTPT